MSKSLVQVPASDEVRQHNALINSPIVLTTLEWRAFTSLLQRINPDDVELKEHFIPAGELLAVGTGGGKAYAQILELSDQFTKKTVRVEQLGPNGERLKQPDYRFIPLLAMASYVEKRGGVVLVLNPLFTPYLLQLAEKGNFTKSRAKELKHLKGSHSFKLYWLLSEYRTFGNRTFTVDELRFRLGIGDEEYKDRFDNFKVKVLEKVQFELAKTDLAFEMMMVRKGRKVEQIRFMFSAKPLLLAKSTSAQESMPPNLSFPLNTPEAEPWALGLLALGVAKAGCEIIRRHLAEGQYSVEYLDYVLQVIQRPRKAKILKPADYVFKCIIGKLLLEEFRRTQEVPQVSSVAPGRKPFVKPVAAAPAETVYQLEEVQQMYETPGPFAKRTERAPTFEEHIERIYLSQGFVLEIRNGNRVLVSRH